MQEEQRNQVMSDAKQLQDELRNEVASQQPGTPSLQEPICIKLCNDIDKDMAELDDMITQLRQTINPVIKTGAVFQSTEEEPAVKDGMESRINQRLSNIHSHIMSTQRMVGTIMENISI